MTNPKIDMIRLRCSDPRAQVRFYADILGMKAIGGSAVGYGGNQAKLKFSQSNDQYTPENNDLYWKITIAVPDIELAYEQLTKQGVEVGEPSQFKDIGYVAHFKDPAGFTIELIDHQFQGDQRPRTANERLLGGGPHLNLLTLRTVVMEPVKASCNRMGMKLLCVQPVESNGFTLYFYAFTDDVPPSSDLTAIENRTWVYQRKYTLLEIQHSGKIKSIRYPEKDSAAAGYAGFDVTGTANSEACKHLLMKSR